MERIGNLVEEQEGARVVARCSSWTEVVSQAATVCADSSVDALILDAHLPGRNGLDVVRTCRELCPNARMAVIADEPYMAYRRRFLGAGADFFWDKSTLSLTEFCSRAS